MTDSLAPAAEADVAAAAGVATPATTGTAPNSPRDSAMAPRITRLDIQLPFTAACDVADFYHYCDLSSLILRVRDLSVTNSRVRGRR